MIQPGDFHADRSWKSTTTASQVTLSRGKNWTLLNALCLLNALIFHTPYLQFVMQTFCNDDNIRVVFLKLPPERQTLFFADGKQYYSSWGNRTWSALLKCCLVVKVPSNNSSIQTNNISQSQSPVDCHYRCSRLYYTLHDKPNYSLKFALRLWQGALRVNKCWLGCHFGRVSVEWHSPLTALSPSRSESGGNWSTS